MHITICDDHIADRKQTERLLGRVANQLKSDGLDLYIDSFGNLESLMHAPMTYQAFFIDYASNNKTSLDVADALRTFGVNAPIFLCDSLEQASDTTLTGHEILPLSYHEYSEIYRIFKPLHQDTLEEAVNKAHSLIETQVPPIEVRGKDETYYIPEADILYIAARRAEFDIYRTNTDVLTLTGKFSELQHSFENQPLFLFVGNSFVVNARHIAEIHSLSMTLDNEEKLTIPLTFSRTAKKIMEELKEDGYL